MDSIIQRNNAGGLPEGLRIAGRDVSAADGRQVPLYLFRLLTFVSSASFTASSLKLWSYDLLSILDSFSLLFYHATYLWSQEKLYQFKAG